jgi:hypothetical protein
VTGGRRKFDTDELRDFYFPHIVTTVKRRQVRWEGREEERFYNIVVCRIKSAPLPGGTSECNSPATNVDAATRHL